MDTSQNDGGDSGAKKSSPTKKKKKGNAGPGLDLS